MPKQPKSALQYVAFYQAKNSGFVFDFPDAPGCKGAARNQDELYEKAKSAIEGWLRKQVLEANTVAAWPRMHRRPNAGEERLHVHISPSLTVAVQFRRARLMRGWSQSELAERVGVSQQQIAKMEDPDGNPTFDSVAKIALALAEPLMVVFE